MNESVVMVTGGAGNLGQAVTREFLERGARVVIPLYKTDLPGALDDLQEQFGERLHSFALDLTTERGAEQAVRQALEWGRRLDVVAHLVGGYVGGMPLTETSIEIWDRMMDLNVKSAWLVSRFAVKTMAERGGGSLVFVSSRAAHVGRAGNVAYSVSKAALLTLVEAIAEEHGAAGIRANAVLPGIIDTEANRQANPDAEHDLWPKPQEIAKVIAFLASPDAGVVNGGAVPVHGRS